MLCWFLLNDDVNQLYAYIYPLPLERMEVRHMSPFFIHLLFSPQRFTEHLSRGGPWGVQVTDPALPAEALCLRVTGIQVQILREPASEPCGPDELVPMKCLKPVCSGPSRWELLLHRHCPQGAENPGEITVVIKYRNKKNKILKRRAIA